MANASQQQAAAKAATTHWRTVHKRLNPDFLYAEDILQTGKREIDLEVVDSGIGAVSVMEGKRKASKATPWIAFRGARKRLGLNVTNCKAMQRLASTGVVEEWRGWVRLMVVEVEYTDQATGQRSKTDAIRIGPKRPQPYDGDAARAARARAVEEQAARDRADEDRQEALAVLGQQEQPPGPTVARDEDIDSNPPIDDDEAAQILKEESSRG